MSMVRFATLCDKCGARSEEYTAWPHCRACHADLCPECQQPGSLREGDGAEDSRHRADTALCAGCLDED